MVIAYDENITSTNIHGVAWDKGIGYVEFMGGRRFAYTMTQELFAQMREAKSIGSFFARNVKGKCPVVWTGYRCNNSPCTKDAHLQGSPGNTPTAGIFRVCTECSKIGRFTGITFTAIPEGK